MPETCGQGTCNRHDIGSSCNSLPDPNPSPTPEGCIDDDDDNYCANSLLFQDCNDNNPNINPGQIEICFNGLDDNCQQGPDTQDNQCRDSDSDGEADAFDCAPNDNRRSHLFTENCSDNIDNDCDNANDPADVNCLTGGGGGCQGSSYPCGVQSEAGVEGCYADGSGSCAGSSPVLVDLDGDGFALTDAAGGVRFDLDADGQRERLSWTAAGADDAWLALDRDGDGLITDGRELFGNYTWQQITPRPNGFVALAFFDAPERGGNSDGLIDGRDAVFTALRLWRDANHDGVSQGEELHPLATLDVARLHLDFKESKREDEHGNRFRYRAKVDDARGAKAGRWSWDVFLVSAP